MSTVIFRDVLGSVDIHASHTTAAASAINARINSSLAFGKCPTRSVSNILSSATIREEFATDSLGNPVAVRER